MQKGFTIIYLVVGLLILGSVGMVGYWLGTNKNLLPISPQNQQQTVIIPTQAINFPTLTPTISNSQPNVLYLGEYQEAEAIFVTNKSLSKYYETGVERFDPQIGNLLKLDGVGISPFKFQDLKNPKKVISFPDNVQQVVDLKFSSDKIFIYLSVLLEGKPKNSYPDNLVNHIYRVNLNNLTSEDLWSNDLSSSKYPKSSGAAYIKGLSDDDNYLVLSIYGCYACEGTEAGELILNIKIRSEKYYPSIGNVQFSLNSGVFSYQKLAPFKEACTPGPGCESDNTRTVYNPSGQTFTEKLP